MVLARGTVMGPVGPSPPHPFAFPWAGPGGFACEFCLNSSVTPVVVVVVVSFLGANTAKKRCCLDGIDVQCCLFGCRKSG